MHHLPALLLLLPLQPAPPGNAPKHQTQPRHHAHPSERAGVGPSRYFSTFSKGRCPGQPPGRPLQCVWQGHRSNCACPSDRALSAALRRSQASPTDFHACLLGEKPAFCLLRKRRFINVFFLFKFICVSFTLNRQFCFSSTVYISVGWGIWEVCFYR